MIIKHYKQGSDEWLKARCGVITMSNAKALISKGRGKEPSLTRQSYLYDVASELLSGKPVEQFKSWDMERGNLLEPFARRAYEMLTRTKVEEVGLVYLDENKTISTSPDGLCGAIGEGGIEIKCPRPRTHMRYLSGSRNGIMPQIQGNMWVTGAEWWDFVSFCPEFEACPLVIDRIDRDDEMIKKINDSAMLAAEEVAAMVDTIRRYETDSDLQAICNETDSDIQAICNEALAAVDNFFNDGEVQIDE